MAEDQRGPDVPETNAMGLMSAHAACEAMLGLIIGLLPFEKHHPADERYFPHLLTFAADKAKPPLSQTLRGDLMAMHSARNGFVHGGVTVGALELDRAIDAAHSLAEHVPLPGNRNVVGIPTVVADIIEIEVIGMWLRHADQQRARGNPRWSADGIARALDEAIRHSAPRIREKAREDPLETARRMADISRGIRPDRTASASLNGVNELARWVMPIALGTTPANLADIRAVVGSVEKVDVGGHPSAVSRPTDPPPAADLRRASSLVSRIILRLWAMDGLTAGRDDDAVVALAQDFLAQPFGFAAGLPVEKGQTR